MYIKDLLKSIKDLFQSSDNSNKQFELNCEKTDSQDNSKHITFKDNNINGNVIIGDITAQQSEFSPAKKGSRTTNASAKRFSDYFSVIIILLMILIFLFVLPYFNQVKALIIALMILVITYSLYSYSKCSPVKGLPYLFMSFFTAFQIYLVITKCKISISSDVSFINILCSVDFLCIAYILLLAMALLFFALGLFKLNLGIISDKHFLKVYYRILLIPLVIILMPYIYIQIVVK